VIVCPVDCIYEYTGKHSSMPNQLYIDPDECIDCGACEVECPWEAIYEEVDLPEVFKSDTELNAQIVHEKRAVAKSVEKPSPTDEEVTANKVAHGLSQ